LDTHNSQLQKFSAHCRNLVSAQVWRVAVAAAATAAIAIAAVATAAATTATSIFGFRLGLSLGYGLDFLLLGTLALESGTLP
jgi:hypothetical protein